MIDLDEIDLAPDRSGSARQIRSGKKRAAKALAERNDKARKKGWREELRNYKNRKSVRGIKQP